MMSLESTLAHDGKKFYNEINTLRTLYPEKDICLMAALLVQHKDMCEVIKVLTTETLNEKNNSTITNKKNKKAKYFRGGNFNNDKNKENVVQSQYFYNTKPVGDLRQVLDAKKRKQNHYQV